jgi:YesN/AraC family two-component response regulator
MNVLEYLHYLKIRKAKELLSSTSYSIKEISYQVGINDEKYFMRLFKKIKKSKSSSNPDLDFRS